jgi:hypothetical protein
MGPSVRPGAFGLALACTVTARGLNAAPPEPPAAVTADSDDAATRALRRLTRPTRPYFRLMGSAALGEGIRFNNPYRLQTQLGEDGESLSLTAPYADFGMAFSTGDPDGLQHGGALHVSLALGGVGQQVITPGYQALYRRGALLGYGRFATPVIVNPDPNLGFELAAGIGWFLTGAFGLNAELVGDLFYGAGTREVRYAVYPILSAQLGVIVDYEVLP